MNPLEAMAKAIYEIRNQDSWENAADWERFDHEKFARAALNALADNVTLKMVTDYLENDEPTQIAAMAAAIRAAGEDK
jgi:hypothetical protein